MGLWLGSGYRLWGGFDSGCSFLAARLNRLVFPKLVEPTCERQRVGRVETVVRVSGGSGVGCVVRVSGGFDSGCSFLAARLNRLVFPKLVEPTCERQRVGRVETRGARLWAFGRGCGVVSTQPFASLTRWLNQLGKWVPRRWGMAG